MPKSGVYLLKYKGFFKMYIIKLFSHSGHVKFEKWENFNAIKKEVIKILDVRGHDNKSTVDLRSLLSCLNYIYSDYKLFRVKKTNSYKVFYQY